MKYILSLYELHKIQDYLISHSLTLNDKNIEYLAQLPYQDLSLTLSLSSIQKKSFDSLFLEKIKAYILRGTGVVDIDLKEKKALENLFSISFTQEFTEKEVKYIKNLNINSNFFDLNFLLNISTNQLNSKQILDVKNIDSCINYLLTLSSLEDFDLSIFPKSIIQNETFQLTLINRFPKSINFFYINSKDILLFLEKNKENTKLLIDLWNYFLENFNDIKNNNNNNSYFFQLNQQLVEKAEELKYNTLLYPKNNNQNNFNIQILEEEYNINKEAYNRTMAYHQKIIRFYQKNIFQNPENISYFFNKPISIQTLKLFNPIIFKKDFVLDYLLKNNICLDEFLDKIPIQIPQSIQNSLFISLLFQNLTFDEPKIKDKILKKRISFLTKTSCMNEYDLISILDSILEYQKNKKLFSPFILQEFMTKNSIFIQNSKVFQHFFYLNPLFLFSYIPESEKKNEELYISFLTLLRQEYNSCNLSSVEISQYKNSIFSSSFVNLVLNSKNENLISLATSFFSFFEIENCPKSFKTHVPYLLNALTQKEILHLYPKQFLIKFQKLQLLEEDYICIFNQPRSFELFNIHNGSIYSLLPLKLKNNYFITLKYIQSVHNKTHQYTIHQSELNTAFANISKNFLKNPYFILESFKIDPFCITFADSSLWSNLDFISNILCHLDSLSDTIKEKKTYLSYFPENIQKFFAKHNIDKNYADSFYSLIIKAQLSQELQPKKVTRSLKI